MHEFIATRRKDWHHLEQLLAKLGTDGLDSLSAGELDTMGRLYRRATSDLAIAQRDFPDEPLVVYLNQLVAHAHPQVYRSEVFELGAALRFLTSGFPQVFRQTAWFTLVAAAIFIFSALAAAYAVAANPDTAEYIVPAGIIDTVKQGQMWTDIPSERRSFESSFIMTNNIKVAVWAFGGGILFGLPTIIAMAMNGLLLGAVGSLCQHYDLSLPLWSFVLPHGVIELTVIFIAGGAGLQLAYGLLAPGYLSRKESLVRAARPAVQLLLGCIALLVIAGIIEGFVSPSSLPPDLKIAFAAFNALWLYSYLLFAGRPLRRRSRQKAGIPSPLA